MGDGRLFVLCLCWVQAFACNAQRTCTKDQLAASTDLTGISQELLAVQHQAAYQRCIDCADSL